MYKIILQKPESLIKIESNKDKINSLIAQLRSFPEVLHVGIVTEDDLNYMNNMTASRMMPGEGNWDDTH